MRVRSMQMNDAHIYCSEEQFEEEFMAVIDLYLKYFEIFGIDKYIMRFSTHSKEGLGKKYVDNASLWEKTEAMVRKAMDNGGINYVEVEDEAAFYGPKIDVQVWSAIGKEFTLATNQVDFAVPPKFDLKFTNAQGEDEIPLCIHRAPLSTHERMIGFLIEHYAGAFPVWLSPVQAVIIPITDSHLDYAYDVVKKLKAAGIRAEVASDNARMNAKIRKAQKQKIPYMLIVGDAEMEADAVALRMRDGEDKGAIPVSDFVVLAKEAIANRS